MTSTPSFERIDYLLRTNKHIERKLIFDHLNRCFPLLRSPWYLGFGSMWFGDFRIAHRQLGILDLVSIERPDYADRASFNRPYNCITVAAGESSQVLNDMDTIRWETPVVAWMDYDGTLSESVVEDFNLLLDKVAPSSILIMSVAASRNWYRGKGSSALRRDQTSVGTVEKFLGAGSISEVYEPQQNSAGNFIDLSDRDFHKFLTDALMTYMQHRLNSGGRAIEGDLLTFVPMYRFYHKDGADMITVGGVVCKTADVASWRRSLADDALLSDANGDVAFTRLDLIPITLKEKLALDSCLPLDRRAPDVLAETNASGVCLTDDQIAKYQRYYRHFPVFVETPV